MGGVHLYKGYNPSPWFPLNSKTVAVLVLDGKLELPTKKELEDRGKSSVLIESITFIQMSWFLTNCIARSAQSLPLTKLDIVTVSYIFITFLTYILWWHKPRNILHPVRVFQTKAHVAYGDIPFSARKSLPLYKPKLRYLTTKQLLNVLGGFPDEVFHIDGSSKVFRFYSGGPYSDHDLISVLVAMPIGMVSASIFCIAWTFDSLESSLVEVVLWRLFSLSFALVLLLLILFTGAVTVIDQKGWMKEVWLVVMISIIVFYMLSRIGLFILAFVALRSLSTAAYETVYWVYLLPHF